MTRMFCFLFGSKLDNTTRRGERETLRGRDVVAKDNKRRINGAKTVGGVDSMVCAVSGGPPKNESNQWQEEKKQCWC